MRFPSSITLISVLFTGVLAAPSTGLQARDLNAFVTSEKAIALQGALSNIGPNGSMVPGAGAGFVVASPSKANPNCESF
jgi:glucoamylase